MSFLVCHAMKYGLTDLRGVSIHNNRESSNSSNPDIDYSRTELNFDALTGESGNPHINYHTEVKKRIEANYVGKKAIRKDAVRLVSIVVSSDHYFFANMDNAETKRFFKVAAEHLAERFGRENVVAAKVHLDETTPHMHFTFVPLRDGRLTAKTIIDQKALISLQNDLPKVMQAAGFNVQRGIEKSENKHIEQRIYKRNLKAQELEVAQEEHQVKHSESKEEPAVVLTSRNALDILNSYIDALTAMENIVARRAWYSSKMVQSDEDIDLSVQARIDCNKLKEAIAKEESTYNATQVALEKSKPTKLISKLNPKNIEKYAKELNRLNSWHENIEKMKIECIKIEAKAVNFDIKPEHAEIVKTMMKENAEQAQLDERAYLTRQYELNNNIRVCYAIRDKLRSCQYEGNNTISISKETHQAMLDGNTTKARDVIMEMRTEVNRILAAKEKREQQRIRTQHRTRQNDGWER